MPKKAIEFGNGDLEPYTEETNDSPVACEQPRPLREAIAERDAELAEQATPYPVKSPMYKDPEKAATSEFLDAGPNSLSAKPLRESLDFADLKAEGMEPAGLGNAGIHDATMKRLRETDSIGREIDPGFKENNPKDAFGVAKAGATSYLYGPVLLEMAVGMAAGAMKYGAHNYLTVAPRASVYTDAAVRHILAFVGGEDLDPEAGEGVEVSHVTAAINSLHVLRAAMINGSFVDDRPPAAPAGWISKLNKSMVALGKLYPDPVARYLAGGKRGAGRQL